MILSATLALAGCAGGVHSAGGYATYDDLKRATDACAARGGRLTLVRGGDARDIQDYTCDKTKAEAQ
ncbi:MAG: hypothetical protein ACK4YQ_12120 [Phenylobacterium sp.]|uniref:hypothetical protein n=1 Tax=Phenylobacterium sp. TaxID=1871053 RepID=UPI003918AC8C